MNRLKKQIVNMLIDDDRIPHEVVGKVVDLFDKNIAQLNCSISVTKAAQEGLALQTYGLEGYIKNELGKKYAQHIAENIDLQELNQTQDRWGDLFIKSKLYIVRT